MRTRTGPCSVMAVVVVAVVCGLCLLAGWVLASPSAAIVPPVLGGWAQHAVALSSRRRRDRRTRRSAIDAVEGLIQSLKAGRGLPGVLREHGGLAHIAPGVDRSLVGATLGVLVQRGGRAVPSLERLSDTLRSVDSLRAEVEAQAAQATASAGLLAALPAALVVVLAAADGRMRHFYLVHPLGAVCLVVSVALSHLGWWLMQRMIGSGG